MTNRPSRVVCTATAVLMACLQCLAAMAAEPDPRSRHPTADGAGVVDEEARLVWSRCVEGMQWNGATCVGEARSMNHSDAAAAGVARTKSDGLPWRLPRVSEMQRAAQWTGPALALFPAAPQGWLWSGTAVVDLSPVNQYRYQNIRRHVTEESANRIAFLHGWAVNPATGEARDDIPKRARLPVRLVRSMD
jgi:hypothetical protein